MSYASVPIRNVNVGESGLGTFGQIVVSGRHIMGADESESAGGRDTGPDPYDYLCIALGACTSMTIRLYVERKKWPLRRVSVTVTHDRVAGDGGKQVDRFSRLIVLEGDLDAEQRDRVLEIANKCPVHNTLISGSRVESELA